MAGVQKLKPQSFQVCHSVQQSAAAENYIIPGAPIIAAHKAQVYNGSYFFIAIFKRDPVRNFLLTLPYPWTRNQFPYALSFLTWPETSDTHSIPKSGEISLNRLNNFIASIH